MTFCYFIKMCLENSFVLICFFCLRSMSIFIMSVSSVYSHVCILCPLSGEPSSFYMGSSYQPLWFPNELYFITSILIITNSCSSSTCHGCGGSFT